MPVAPVLGFRAAMSRLRNSPSREREGSRGLKREEAGSRISGTVGMGVGKACGFGRGKEMVRVAKRRRERRARIRGIILIYVLVIV
jgi:hypothetical protein